VTNNHEKAAYLVDARIKGKGERKFFDIRDEPDTSRVYICPKCAYRARGRVRIPISAENTAKIQCVIVGMFDNAQNLDRAVERLAAAGFETLRKCGASRVNRHD